MEMSMKEVLDRNHEKMKQRRLQELKAKKLERRKETIVNIFFGIIIMLIVFFALAFANKDVPLEECLNQGYSFNTCQRKLGM